MIRWYPKLFATSSDNDADLMVALDAADAYEAEHGLARNDLKMQGKIENMASRISSLAEYRFAQLQDLESILDFIEQREKRVFIRKYEHNLLHYNRALSERQAKDFADVSDEVKLVRDVRTRVAYVRNLYLGIMKGLEYMHFQITNVTKLRCAGLEDAVVDFRDSPMR